VPGVPGRVADDDEARSVHGRRGQNRITAAHDDRFKVPPVNSSRPIRTSLQKTRQGQNKVFRGIMFWGRGTNNTLVLVFFFFCRCLSPHFTSHTHIATPGRCHDTSTGSRIRRTAPNLDGPLHNPWRTPIARLAAPTHLQRVITICISHGWTEDCLLTKVCCDLSSLPCLPFVPSFCHHCTRRNRHASREHVKSGDLLKAYGKQIVVLACLHVF